MTGGVPVAVAGGIAGALGRVPPGSSACGAGTVAGGLAAADGGIVRFGPCVGVLMPGVGEVVVAGPPPARETFGFGEVTDVPPVVGAGPTGGSDGEPVGPGLPVAGAKATGALVAVLAAGATFAGAGAGAGAGADAGAGDDAGTPVLVPLCAVASIGGATDDSVTPAAGDGVALGWCVAAVGDAWVVAPAGTGEVGSAAGDGDGEGAEWPPEDDAEAVTEVSTGDETCGDTVGEAPPEEPPP
jgi:hypothetical protein